MFVDEVDIDVSAGAGGRGAISFRREKFIPRGGPDGGDGGAGGSVYLIASPHHNTLVNYRFHPDFAAPRGGHGEGALRTGKSGKDLELPVPPGTVAYRIDEFGHAHQFADLVGIGDRVMAAKGGRGGRGNARFTSSTNRTPRRADPGEAGEVFKLRLRMKLLADVGIVGYPNVGKSTLIARVSAARPKIADYPFTTLVPNLGVVALSDDRSFVMADVPGLIEGAHEGKGLGHRFLGHVERTKVLLHVVDVSEASGRDPVEELDVIRRELEQYVPNADTLDPDALPLAARPQVIAANRIDILADPERLDALRRRAAELDVPFHAISAVTGEGVPQLLETLWPYVQHVSAERALQRSRITSSPAAHAPAPREADDVDHLVTADDADPSPDPADPQG
ncbi:MAG TPA: GTPase ObgE [Luteitalea sp.]|nr:GTPase ObgE [Luteitalea sp.]